jgi:chromosome segregation ATPase
MDTDELMGNLRRQVRELEKIRQEVQRISALREGMEAQVDFWRGECSAADALIDSLEQILFGDVIYRDRDELEAQAQQIVRERDDAVRLLNDIATKPYRAEEYILAKRLERIGEKKDSVWPQPGSDENDYSPETP